MRKAKNEVLPGIRLVAACLQAGVLQFAEGCRDTIREFSLYCWQDDDARDVPKKENDHAMDDIRYFVATVLKKEQQVGF